VRPGHRRLGAGRGPGERRPLDLGARGDAPDGAAPARRDQPEPADRRILRAEHRRLAEAGPAGGIVNWANYNTAAGAPAPAYDGTGYLAFNTNIAGGSVFQDVPVTVGTGGTYEASVFLSSQSGPASGTFCLWSLASSNTDLCSAYNVNSATGYQNYILVFSVPQQTSTLRFQVYPTANGGTTDMDTASLTRIG